MRSKYLFFFFISSKERQQNSSNATVSWLQWNTNPIHWVLWSVHGFLPLPLHLPLLYDSKLIHQSPVMIQLIFIQVQLQNKKALLLLQGEPGPPHTGLLFRAALPCSGEFIYIRIYHPIQALSKSRLQYPVTEDRLAGEESAMKILQEGTSRLTSFLMKGLTENSLSKGLDTEVIDEFPGIAVFQQEKWKAP